MMNNIEILTKTSIRKKTEYTVFLENTTIIEEITDIVEKK